MLDAHFVRSHFPALAAHGDDNKRWAFLDNAGGTLMPRQVIARATAYMERYQMQIGASYPASREATQAVESGQKAVAQLLNCASDEVVLGSSTSTNVYILARAFGEYLQKGDEILVTDLDHEANRGAWLRLRNAGIVVRSVPLVPNSTQIDLETYRRMLSPRTRLVCATLCANVVGEICDFRTMITLAHEAGAWFCADAVAYAPHRHLDVKALDVDFCLVSLYKVFGPHLGALYGRRELLQHLPGQNHAFFSETMVPYKFQPGGVAHELAAALPGIIDYLSDLHDHHHGVQRPEDWISKVFSQIAATEQELSERLLAGLDELPRFRRLGGRRNDVDDRIGLVAFTHESIRSDKIVAALEEERIACRGGDFYAKAAIAHFGLEGHGGVVRLSFAHYNTMAEVERVLATLSQLG
jgi:cysteine desulfurase family protein (TIGR01976 family)